MILIEEIVSTPEINNKEKDFLDIEWYETTKTIIRRKTRNGLDVAIRKNSSQPLEDGDILFQDDKMVIELFIKPCDCIVFKPANMRDMGVICFEIGNKHIPIYIDDKDVINVAYEAPLYILLQRAGYQPQIEEKKLLKTHMLRVHGHGSSQVNRKITCKNY